MSARNISSNLIEVLNDEIRVFSGSTYHSAGDNQTLIRNNKITIMTNK